jgi:hypothetical protein
MNTTTNLLKINGRDVYADRNYLLSEAAILAGKSVQTLRLATKQIDERRLNAKIEKVETSHRKNRVLLLVKAMPIISLLKGVKKRITNPTSAK